MRLYTRLVVSYGYLVTLVLVGAAGAAFGFHALGSRIGAVLTDNVASVQASSDMVEALERQDSAVLQALLRGEAASADVAAAETRFLEALATARSNVTEDREDELLRTIDDRYAAYREARDRLLASKPDRPLASYEDGCSPQFDAVKTAVHELLELNHAAMRRADREAQAAATERAIGYGALTALALVSLGVLSRQLRRHVVAPLDELRAATAAVEGGDTRRRVAASVSGELGDLARELNRLLDELDDLRGRSESRRAELRALLVALVRTVGERVVLIDLAGDVVATTLDGATTTAVAREVKALRERLESETRDDGPFEASIDAGGEPMRARLLATAGGRPLAWLVVA